MLRKILNKFKKKRNNNYDLSIGKFDDFFSTIHLGTISSDEEQRIKMYLLFVLYILVNQMQYFGVRHNDLYDIRDQFVKCKNFPDINSHKSISYNCDLILDFILFEMKSLVEDDCDDIQIDYIYRAIAYVAVLDVFDSERIKDILNFSTLLIKNELD